MEALWKAAMEGNAEQYHGMLSPNVVVVTNGQVDDAQWGQAAFVRDLFSKVRYADMRAVTPMGTDAATNTFFVNYRWSLIVLATGQDIDMGLWSTAVRLDANNKIVHIKNVCSDQPLQQLTHALTIKRPFRAALEAFIAAMNSGSTREAASKLDKDFTLTRNDEDDPDFTPMNLPKLFQHVTWNFRLLDYAPTGPFDVLVNLETTVTPKTRGEPVRFLEGWHVSFDAQNKQTETIVSIDCVCDSLAAYEADQLIRAR
jgi:hypothetical protein